MGEIEGCKNNHVLVKLKLKKINLLIRNQQTFSLKIVNILGFVATQSL